MAIKFWNPIWDGKNNRKNNVLLEKTWCEAS